jgi:hypothetical protein
MLDSLFETVLGNSLYLMMIILIAIAAVGIFAWYKFGSSLKGLLRGNEKYPVLLLKQSPNIIEKSLDVEADAYLVDIKARRGWFIMGIQRTPSGKLAGCVITEDSCIPQMPGIPHDLENLCQIVEKTHPYIELGRVQVEIENMQREVQNAPLANWFGVSALAVILDVLIIATIILITSDLMPWA